MKNKIIFILFFFIVLFSYSGIFSEDNKESYEGKIINKIIYKNNKKVKKREIDAIISTKEGMLLDLSLIEQDYLKLMELAYFEDIIISTEEVKNKDGSIDQKSINLVFEFIEKPTIVKIIFSGNKNVGIGFLIGEVKVKNGDIVDKGAIASDVLALENLYKDKGFSYVKVDYEIFQDERLKQKNQAHLIFKIEEGPETFISEIEFIGNTKISSSTLKSKMKTKERKFFGLQKGTFQENIFYEDIENLVLYYRELGYYKVDIYKPIIDRFTIEEKGVKKESIKIRIQIREGKQYKFGGLDIQGNVIFSKEDLISGTKLRSGQLFNFSKFQLDLYSIRTKYTNAGYIETRIDPVEKIDEENNIVYFTLMITESDRSYIEAIYFKGNEKTKSYVLERAIYTKVGDILDESNLRNSVSILMGMGYFNNVTFEIQQGSKKGLLKIIYILEERLTADFKFGLTVTTTKWPPEVTLFGELSEKNFLGREIGIGGKLDLSLFRQGIDFSMSDPWFLGLPVYLSGSFKFYHNWNQKVLRKLTSEDYTNYKGSVQNPSEADIRDYYDALAENVVENNKNYIGASGPNSWGNLGLHDINMEFAFSGGYRFLNYFSVSGFFSISPIYTFLPTASINDRVEYLKKVNEIDSESYRKLLLDNDGWSLKSKIGSTFTISTVKRKINPYDGLKFSISTAYTFGHFDSLSLSTSFTYYLKLLEMDFNNWIFNNVLVFNCGASFLFPGFRNLGGELNGEPTQGKGPILFPSDYLYVDGFFIGRGWGASVGTTSGYEGKLTNKVGYARFDTSIEYRIPISEQFIWFASFIDFVNLVEGPTRKYPLTDKYGNVVTLNGKVVYGTDTSNAWMWWEQLESNNFYNKDMTNWYGLENWYGSFGFGFQLTIPQLPLSFYVVKRFKINYQGGLEWVGNVPNSPNLDFVLSMVGVYF